MNTATRDYPVGDLRVSDADRDRALAELSEAWQAGRLEADEFNQRSEQALGARTGRELGALLADLPADRAPAGTTVRRPAHHQLAAWVVAGASGVTATSLAGVAVANGLSHGSPGPDLYKRELAREILARMGLKVPIPPPPPPPGFDWVGTVTPAVIAVLLVAVMIVVLRAGRRSPRQDHRI
jgi:hypothetical protein